MSTPRKSFKTSKGTELPIISLKGKEYLQVAHRLQWFVEDNANYNIETMITEQGEKHVVMRSRVAILDNTGKVLKTATAYKREDQAGFADYIEKAETGSIGRALAMLGYGTQFTADELEENQRLADAPLPTPAPVESSVKKERVASFSSRTKMQGDI